MEPVTFGVGYVDCTILFVEHRHEDDHRLLNPWIGDGSLARKIEQLTRLQELDLRQWVKFNGQPVHHLLLFES
ncbi:hypothetical protein GBA52_015799 [Prunus armeniaca]|nr:hypothetical protein GBA52_015799 [Prunus armeniaca]